MSIVVTTEYDNYTDYCETKNLGKHIAELPQSVQDRLNEAFDGSEIGFGSNLDPDNVWVNGINVEDDKEFLVGRDILTSEEYADLVEKDKLEEYVSENQEEIFDNTDVMFLGREDNEWYTLN